MIPQLVDLLVLLHLPIWYLSMPSQHHLFQLSPERTRILVYFAASTSHTFSIFSWTHGKCSCCLCLILLSWTEELRIRSMPLHVLRNPCAWPESYLFLLARLCCQVRIIFFCHWCRCAIPLFHLQVGHDIGSIFNPPSPCSQMLIPFVIANGPTRLHP